MPKPREWVRIERDTIYDSGGYTLQTSGCGCCATDLTWPPVDYMTEWTAYEAPSLVELDMLRAHLLAQLELVDQLRIDITKGPTV